MSLKALLVAALAAVSSTMGVLAQDYPARTVTIVVPFPPGGPVDVIPRIVAEELTELLGQSFIVENMPGAGGLLGLTHGITAEPNGYTLMTPVVGTPTILAQAEDAKFDAISDMSHIVRLAKSDYLLYVNPALPINNVQELIQYAKDNPGALNFGAASANDERDWLRLSAETGIESSVIRYRGTGPLQAALIANEVQLSFTSYRGDMIDSGQIRPIATTGLERSPILPDLATIAETVPGFAVSPSWFGISAPGGLAPEVIETLNQAINTALKDEEVLAKIAKAFPSYQVVGGSAEDYVAVVQGEVDAAAP